MNTLVDTMRPVARMSPLLAAPFALRAYVVFAALVVIADYGTVAILALEPWRARVVPYTGWSASLTYAFTVWFAAALPYQAAAFRGRMRLFGIVVQHFVLMLFGSCQMLWPSANNFNNPYLTVSPFRYVWVIIVPLFWIAVLFTPSMNRLCRPDSARGEA